MRQVSVNKAPVSERDYKKAYLKLLTSAAKKADEFFFVADDPESDEIRPFFYVSMASMVSIVLFVYVAIH